MTKIRVLLADDDESARLLISTRLTELGMEVITAASGQEAMAIVDSDEPPQLYVLDIMMPLVTGVELCRRVRERERQQERRAYIILLSALNREQYMERALAAGADDFLSKPLALPEFDSRVRTACRLLALQDEVARLRREPGGVPGA